MNLLQFMREFPDEAACRQKFKEERDKIGITPVVKERIDGGRIY